MDKTITYIPISFEAAVQRKLLLKEYINGKSIMVEVVAVSKSLDEYDVVVDFRELELALDEQLLLLCGALSYDSDVKEVLAVALKLAENMASKVPVFAKIAEVSFVYDCGRRVSLRP